MPIALLIMTTSCYKDEVVLGELTYNVFDPDYTGPAFIEVTSVGLQQPIPGIWNQVIGLQVKSELFPNPTTYSLYVECLNDTLTEEIIQQPPDIHEFTYVRSDVDLGTEYCYEFSLRVQLSNTRADEHCFTAQ